MTCNQAATCPALWLHPSPFEFPVSIPANVIEPIVDLGYAQYQGYFDTQTNITNFLGVRYAAPPIGQYRSPPIATTHVRLY